MRSEPSWASATAGQLQHFVLGSGYVASHQIRSEFGLPTRDGTEDLLVLTRRNLTVVVDADGGKHDSFMLAAQIGDGANQQAVACELGDANMEIGINLNEMHVAGA